MNETYSSNIGGDATTTPSGGIGTTSGADQSTKDAAKTEARATGEQVKEGTKHVAEVGKDEVKNVARETGQQAKELLSQTRSQLMDQSAQQQTRVAEGLRSLSDELASMARSSDQQGVASDLAQQASQRVGDVASWLDQRDPGSLVSELKQFARQRPGTFLAAAAALGVVGGRLSRSLVAEHQESSSSPATSGTSVTTGTLAGGYSASGSPVPATSGAGHDPLAPGTSAGAPTSGLSAPVTGTDYETGTSPTTGSTYPDVGGSGAVR